LILDLHVQPGASRSEFAGEHGGRLKVPRRNVRITAGLKSRRKRVTVEGAEWRSTASKA
jgi:uncharacterized protein YggU (UPF0235/DUF167 family)